MKRIVFKLYYLVPLLLLPILMTARVHGHSGDVFTAFATVAPTIDGVKGAGEWDDADCKSDTMRTGSGSTSDLTICVKNDETYLYLLAIVTDQDYSDPQEFGFDFLNFTFDNDHDGILEMGDDILALRYDGLFLDFFISSVVCCNTSNDVFDGGTNDLIANITHTNPVPDGIGTYTAEYQHPLDSADDAHDFSLASGDVVGFRFSMADGDAVGGFHWPISIPALADIIIASGKVDVEIDIKPGSDPNCFNNNGHGVIPVAILSTGSFDASTVDPFSLSLDGAGVQEKGNSGNIGSLEDVDSDGDLDLVVHFVDGDLTYQGSDTIATLSGETFDGNQIEGTDSICIVP